MTTTDLEPFDVVDATFRPRRTDDLKPGVAAWIGHRGLFRAWYWFGEGEPYCGELALTAYYRPGHPWQREEEWPLAGYASPSGDFEIHRLVPGEERQARLR